MRIAKAGEGVCWRVCLHSLASLIEIIFVKIPYLTSPYSVDQDHNFYDGASVVQLQDVLDGEWLDLTKVDIYGKITLVSSYSKHLLGLLNPRIDISIVDGDSDLRNRIKVAGRSANRLLQFRFSNFNSPTPHELKVREALSTNFRSYKIVEQACAFHDDGFYFLDFLITDGDRKLGIEADGYYHFTRDGIIYDKVRDALIWNLYGIDILRLSNSEIESMSPEELRSVILARFESSQAVPVVTANTVLQSSQRFKLKSNGKYRDLLRQVQGYKSEWFVIKIKQSDVTLFCSPQDLSLLDFPDLCTPLSDGIYKISFNEVNRILASHN